MWFLNYLIIVLTITNINCASYRGTNHLETKIEEIQNLFNKKLQTIENKFDNILQESEQTNIALKDLQLKSDELQKRSDVWATHEHFITSWLDQISAVDRKLDIIIKGQERLNKVQTQLSLLQEQINKIDIDKFESLLNLSDQNSKVKAEKCSTTSTNNKNNALFSFIDEYTTRGVLSALNRIENQLTQQTTKPTSTNCSNTDILEDIASKVDIIVDKISTPDVPTTTETTNTVSIDNVDDNVVEPVPEPSSNNNPSDSYNCIKEYYGLESITLLERNAPDSFEDSEYLNKTWDSYVDGFQTNTANWYGLFNLYDLSIFCYLKLRVELWDFAGNFAWAEYGTFKVIDNEKYVLKVGDYSGNATDSLSVHNGMPFSTYDRNNDNAPDCCRCAVTYGSGWWFNKCFESNLNGKYSPDPYDIDYYDGIIWEGWLGNYSLKKAKMIITST